MSTRTPGPWTMARCSCGDSVCRRHTISAGQFYQGSGFNLADATLICAVPDLLEACEAAEHWLSQEDRTIEPTEMLRVLRAAIAKAGAAP